MFEALVFGFFELAGEFDVFARHLQRVLRGGEGAVAVAHVGDDAVTGEALVVVEALDERVGDIDAAYGLAALQGQF